MTLRNKLKKHFFWKYACVDDGLFSKTQDYLYRKIEINIKWTYLFFLFFIFSKVFDNKILSKATMVNPLWPMKVFDGIALEFLFTSLCVLIFIVFLILSCNYNSRFFRIAAFILFLIYAAWSNSFGKINHNLHLPLMVLFCFTLIPNRNINNYKQKAILIFASAQFFLLMAYTLTGFWKVFWGIIQLLKGEVSIFSQLSFRNILIEQFQNFQAPILGEFFMEHYIIGWIVYWVVILIELFSIFIFFKPKLHKSWGILLIFLHFSTVMILNVNMYASVIPIGVLLIMSPFNNKQ